MMSVRLKHGNCYRKINHMCVRNPIKGEWHEAQILQNIFSQWDRRICESMRCFPSALGGCIRTRKGHTGIFSQSVLLYGTKREYRFHAQHCEFSYTDRLARCVCPHFHVSRLFLCAREFYCVIRLKSKNNFKRISFQ